MRWKRKEPKPVRDITQWHTVFAWMPHDTTDGNTVWLETVCRKCFALRDDYVCHYSTFEATL